MADGHTETPGRDSEAQRGAERVSITEEDRDMAAVIYLKARTWGADPIAKALAEERAKARAPFLALADELEGWQDNAVRYAAQAEPDAVTGAMARARAMAYGRAIDLLSHAAEDPQ